jgi:phage terminase large subunit-like protein
VVALRQLKRYKPTIYKADGSKYEKSAADNAVTFINCLNHTKGEWYGQPFELIDWQEKIIRDIFGIQKANGDRQFNSAYIEIPKKQGKSELAAAVALLLTCGDYEHGGEVYGCASDRQQASIVFDVAVEMVEQCPALKARIKPMLSQKRLIYKPLGSFYQVLSAEAYTKHGLNVHGVVFDELHAQPNRQLFDVMMHGSGDARKQPLFFLISTAGTDRHSICWEVHQKAEDIIAGRKVDPTFYPVIYSAKDEDDWTSEKVWKQVNPSLGITVEIEKLRVACDNAKSNPAEENLFRQLRLNQWVKQSVRWMPMTKWDACGFPVDADSLRGRVCYGGLDLASTTDITAFVLVFPPLDEGGKYEILPFFWIPEDNVSLRVKRDHVPYDIWEQQGFLYTTEGNVVHYGYIENFIDELGAKYNIREIAFDRWGAVQMVQNLEGLGFTVVPFGQGFKDMSPPTKEFMRRRWRKIWRTAGILFCGGWWTTSSCGQIPPETSSRTRKSPPRKSTARWPPLWRSTAPSAVVREAETACTAKGGC